MWCDGVLRITWEDFVERGWPSEQCAVCRCWSIRTLLGTDWPWRATAWGPGSLAGQPMDGRSPITSSPFTAWPHSHKYMRLRGGNHCAGRSRGTHPSCVRVNLHYYQLASACCRGAHQRTTLSGPAVHCCCTARRCRRMHVVHVLMCSETALSPAGNSAWEDVQTGACTVRTVGSPSGRVRRPGTSRPMWRVAGRRWELGLSYRPGRRSFSIVQESGTQPACQCSPFPIRWDGATRIVSAHVRTLSSERSRSAGARSRSLACRCFLGVVLWARRRRCGMEWPDRVVASGQKKRTGQGWHCTARAGGTWAIRLGWPWPRVRRVWSLGRRSLAPGLRRERARMDGDCSTVSPWGESVGASALGAWPRRA